MDYLLIDQTKQEHQLTPVLNHLARAMCHRRLGVGAYGLILLEESGGGKLRASYRSRLGLTTSLLTDPARALARYAFDSGLLGDRDAAVMVNEQSFAVDLIDRRSIMVGLGAPLAPQDGSEHHREEARSLRESLREAPTRSITVGDRSWTYTPVDVVDTQAVLFLGEVPIAMEGMTERLAEAANVKRTTLVRVYSRTELHARSFDTTAVEQPSSGDGAAAAVVAAAVNGLADRAALVHTRGGDLYVDWDEESNEVYVTAPVDYVFTGSYDPPE